MSQAIRKSVRPFAAVSSLRVIRKSDAAIGFAGPVLDRKAVRHDHVAISCCPSCGLVSQEPSCPVCE